MKEATSGSPSTSGPSKESSSQGAQTAQTSSDSSKDDQKVQLNIGGRVFESWKSTLCKYSDSYFDSMLSGRHNLTKSDPIFIDRRGEGA